MSFAEDAKRQVKRMIDEKKLIEDLIPILNKNSDMLLAGKIIGTVDRQPQVGGWIPASERLPEKDGYYFVTKRFMDGRIRTDIEPFWVGADWWKSELHFDGISLWEVLAWQPLPEPYKAGDEE